MIEVMVLFNLHLSLNIFNHFFSHIHPQNSPVQQILLFAFPDEKTKDYRVKDGKWTLREGK